MHFTIQLLWPAQCLGSLVSSHVMPEVQSANYDTRELLYQVVCKAIFKQIL